MQIQNPAIGSMQTSILGVGAKEEPKQVQAKTDCKIVLEKFDPASKAKVIREVKLLLPQLNLVEVQKAQVHSRPRIW